MVLFLQLLTQAFKSGAVTTCFNDFKSDATGNRTRIGHALEITSGKIHDIGIFSMENIKNWASSVLLSFRDDTELFFLLSA